MVERFDRPRLRDENWGVREEHETRSAMARDVWGLAIIERKKTLRRLMLPPAGARWSALSRAHHSIEAANTRGNLWRRGCHTLESPAKPGPSGPVDYPPAEAQASTTEVGCPAKRMRDFGGRSPPANCIASSRSATSRRLKRLRPRVRGPASAASSSSKKAAARS
jgi:hypothetical protein